MVSTKDAVGEALSGCRYGEGIPIAGTAWNSVTTIHDIDNTGAVIDAVYLRLWNTTDAEIEVSLVLNPNDQATQADVDASTVPVLVPPKGSVWALEGEKFRRHGSGTPSYTVAAYVGASDANNVVFTGWYVRFSQTEETA